MPRQPTQNRSNAKPQPRRKPVGKKPGAKPTARPTATTTTKRKPSPARPTATKTTRPAPAKKTANASVPPGTIRLHKLLADAGIASRRDCEVLITQGRVAVNGKTVSKLPAWADPDTDKVKVDGKPIKPHIHGKQDSVYVLVHKPRHVVSTTSDPQGRKCVTELVDLPKKRLFPVGRLDVESTGLMLLTNDGELANRLAHPRYEVTKQYQASVRGHVSEEDLKKLKNGLYLAHTKNPHAQKYARDTRSRAQGPAHAVANAYANKTDADKTGGAVNTKLASMARVELIGYSRDKAHGQRTNLAITLREGQNREIRRMLARLGYKVRRLKRIAIGPIKITGLGLGQWRPLTSREVNMLRKTAGIETRPAKRSVAEKR